MRKGAYSRNVQGRLSQIRAWAGEGVTQTQIARKLGISPGTLSGWKRRYPPVAEALAGGRTDGETPEAPRQDPATAPEEDAVLSALLARATGMTLREKVRERRAQTAEDGSQEEKMVTTKVVEKQQPPDLAAIRLYLEHTTRQGKPETEPWDETLIRKAGEYIRTRLEEEG
jgi:transcriptional regulator with XRE-family HTH domain